jgi:hypothetical protein
MLPMQAQGEFMKIMLFLVFGMLSFSAFGKTLESFNCRTNLMKIVLEEGEKEKATVFYAGLQKSFDIIENRFIASNEKTKILLSNPDTTFFSKEQYIIELDGNLLSSKEVVTLTGTISKYILPYSIHPVPILTKPMPVSCLAKLKAK